jgi:hypothetical protein
MEILRQAADQIIQLPLYATTAGIAYVENVNVIQGKIHRRLYLVIIANATTFRVTATMESFVLERIMGCANVENVFAIQNGTVQDTPHVSAEPLMIPASHHGESF